MVTEIVEFKLNENVDEKLFMVEADNFCNYFKSTFKGFIDIEFTKNEDGWITILHWENMDYVKACSEVLKTGPGEIANYASLTDSSSTKLTFLEQKLFLK